MKSFLTNFPAGIPYAQLLQGRAVERAAGIINLMLVLFIAWNLARLTWSLWPMPQNPASAPLLPSSAVSDGATTPDATKRLTDLHLFGEAKEQEPAPDSALTAPETQLKLILSGVLSADDKHTARAIIAGPDGEEKPYAVGDTLPGNATLQQILVDRVILKSGGHFETLRLPEDTNGVATAPDAMGAATMPGAMPVPGGPSANLQQYRQQILNNPAKLFELVQVVPINQNGKFLGFRLGPGRDPRMLHRFGLQAGDTVTEVNGIALDDPAKGAQALQSIATATSINLTIKRGGAEQQVTVRLDGGAGE